MEENKTEREIEIKFKYLNGRTHTLTWKKLDKETFRVIEDFFNIIKIRR